jgi:hypothetical protein
MSAAFFVVRATVKDAAKRKAFDKWYQTEHLPDAAKSFGVVKAWRFWSLTDPSLHQATYQFADEASLDRAMKGEDLKRLVADFNRDWPDVTRTRETFVLAEEFCGVAVAAGALLPLCLAALREKPGEKIALSLRWSEIARQSASRLIG